MIFCYIVVSGWSNAVNFTDGLDGLAGGSAAMVLATYVVIAFWQERLNCANGPAPACYDVRDPLDLAVVAAAATGACVGFLWWNAAPAKIFMGDTGSLALGGLVAGLSMTTRTELLAIVIGGLFMVEMISVVAQIAVFRTTRRRLFRMAPVPPPLRARRVGGNHGDHPVLAARRRSAACSGSACSTASSWASEADVWTDRSGRHVLVAGAGVTGKSVVPGAGRAGRARHRHRRQRRAPGRAGGARAPSWCPA